MVGGDGGACCFAACMGGASKSVLERKIGKNSPEVEGKRGSKMLWEGAASSKLDQQR